MTTPTLKIKITPAPKLRGKMDVRFPANVDALSPIILNKSGGNYTFSFDALALTDVYQPWDNDLAAIAALTTTSYGRSFLELADAPAARTLIGSAVLRGYISGLTLSNDPVTPNTILNIAPGIATSDDITASIEITSAFSKTTASWSVGSGNGSLDSGSVANNTWYHVFAIMRVDTGVVDFLFSTSATAPTMPSGYSKKRRIGSILTDASGNIIPFTQFGNEFLWKTIPNHVSAGSPPPTTATLMSLIVPTGIQVIAKFSCFLNSNELIRRAVFLTSPDQVQSATSIGSKSSLAAGSNLSPGYPGIQQGDFMLRTNTSGQIYFQLDGSSANTTLRFITLGWIDNL